MRLDLGCGPRKKDGFIGVDAIQFPGVDMVADLCWTWPWEDGSIVEVHSSHFIEHLDAWERVHFANELYRVLSPGGSATIICPHWCNQMAYGDPTHKWPPVSEFWFAYLNRDWRRQWAPHTDVQHNPRGFNCNFESKVGCTVIQAIPEAQRQLATAHLRDTCQEVVATLTALK